MSHQLRIIEICTAESLGGLELYFATCCKKLKERGHDISAVLKKDSKLHKLLKEELDHFLVAGTFLQSFFHLRKALKQLKPDVVHVHHKKDLLLCALLKRISTLKFRLIHTRHMDQPRSKKNPYHTFIYRSFDLIIAITNRLKKQIIDKIDVDPEKVVSLYHGVALPKSKEERGEEIGIKTGYFNIGVIARIDDKKEQKVIIESVNLMKNRKICLYLIGSVTNERYLLEIQQIIKKEGLENQVVLTGFIKNPQELMPCFDTVVLTTGNETFGLVLAEAMRMGISVIGAKGGGVPEIIDHGVSGLMFEPGNPEDLKKQLETMMNEEVRNKLKKAGKKKADTFFEIERHFNELEEFFNNSLKNESSLKD